jgi:hypothetical protein
MKKTIISVAVIALLSLGATSCKSEEQRLKEAEIEYYEKLLKQYKTEQKRLREVEELLYQAEYGEYSKGVPATTIDKDILELEEKIEELKSEL